MDDCHPGVCKDENVCNKKVKLFCPCKRVKKDFACSSVQKERIEVPCDEVCTKLKKEKSQAEAALLAQKRQAEEIRNQEEIEKFERKFKPRRKGRDKLDRKQLRKEANNNYWKYSILTIFICVIGIAVYYTTIQKV